MQSFNNTTAFNNAQFNPSLEKAAQPQWNNNQWQQAGGQSLIPIAPSSAAIRPRAWNTRRINLRTRNWGSRSENGWSAFNHSLYTPQGLAQWERPSVILQELRATHGNRSRGLGLPLAAAAAPIVAAIPAAPATIVPVNMLPAPINDGSKYAKLVGSAPRSAKYRRHLKQPLSNNAAVLTPLSAGLLNNGYALPASAIPASNQGLTRKQKRALRKQNKQQSRGLSNTFLTPLGTSATSGLAGLPAAAPVSTFGAPVAPVSNQKLTRKQKKALKRQQLNSFYAPNVLPAGQPVVNAIPVTNVLASPVLSAAAPLAPITNTFVKTEPIVPLAPVMVGRSAF